MRSGEPVLFGNQGALYGNALTLFDHATGTVWSQISGEVLAGSLAGDRLELVPSTLTDWWTWRREHPETLALDADGGPSGFEVDDTYLVVEVGDDALAVPVATLREHGVANVEVAGLPVAVVAEPAPGGSWAVHSRRLDERAVRLALEGDHLVEVDGPGRWRAWTGVPTDGAPRLDPLGALTIVPDDFPVRFPAGRVWEP